MKRITRFQKQIFEAHLQAHEDKKWDYPKNAPKLLTAKISGRDELKKLIVAEVRNGKTVEALYCILEDRIQRTGSVIYSALGFSSENYKKAIRGQFRDWLNEVGITDK